MNGPGTRVDSHTNSPADHFADSSSTSFSIEDNDSISRIARFNKPSIPANVDTREEFYLARQRQLPYSLLLHSPYWRWHLIRLVESLYNNKVNGSDKKNFKCGQQEAEVIQAFSVNVIDRLFMNLTTDATIV